MPRGPNVSFGSGYADIYDALYRDKDYVTEAQFVLEQIREIVSTPDLRVLDLGCGTGLHDVAFSEQGVKVVGIDRSPHMVAAAERNRGSLPVLLRNRLEFRVADIRTADIGQKFDAVVALFHVLSYMQDDNSLDAALATVRRHLKPGGAFLCDFWNGLAMLRHAPEAREKTIVINGRQIRRKGRPEWETGRSLVRVNYQIEVTDLRTGLRTVTSEQHIMRYLFVTHLRSRLARAGLDVLFFGKWLTQRPPSASTFTAYLLARTA
jgi:SAM-dependent methyltransferase